MRKDLSDVAPDSAFSIEPVEALQLVAMNSFLRLPRVSVITATRNRRDYLERAAHSVKSQIGNEWTWIIVDDGSTDSTPSLIRVLQDEIGSERLAAVRTDGVGLARARNIGLATSKSDWIVYLDDDNLIHPLWTRIVAWLGTMRPNLEVIYGARAVDRPSRVRLCAPGDFPIFHQERFDRSKLLRANFIDINAVAHRRDLPEARFDERTDAHSDWELLLRLSSFHAIEPVPAIACTYLTTAPNRLVDESDAAKDFDWIRQRHGFPHEGFTHRLRALSARVIDRGKRVL